VIVVVLVVVVIVVVVVVVVVVHCEYSSMTGPVTDVITGNPMHM